ncbi:MAG: Hsp20/alpha crystallin family protein [Lachnospiraceae bacterium]|nr:Hsp20/alpha crystallin family protein [Lachnospiraceae bacterium]MBQ6091805.1 Hsp20/alpha crystallin family protein [Lachnospiraceae bacterium]
MLLPSIFGENLLDDWMDFPKFEFPNIDRKLYGKHASHVMKTDVQEVEDGYEVDIDLPGFKKDEIKLSLDNGYLSVSASKSLDNDKKDRKGKLIRQERYAGSMARSFFVGDNVTEENIKAKFEDGVLKLHVPKEEPAKVPEKKFIAIEG